jgi:hypothetical protein
MANRAYLYSLSNQPTSYADRPETVTGLSEWAYAIPFSYRALMSGDPRRCASLLSDGFEDEPADGKTKLYAISADFEVGFARLKRFFAIARPLVGTSSPRLLAEMEETIRFLEAHRDRYLLLETVELDCMNASGEAELQTCVDNEIDECRSTGEAIDELPEDPEEASRQLRLAIRGHSPLAEAFQGLQLNDDYDNVRGGGTKYPLGLGWSTELFFGLWNRTEFEANQ